MFWLILNAADYFTRNPFEVSKFKQCTWFLRILLDLVLYYIIVKTA